MNENNKNAGDVSRRSFLLKGSIATMGLLFARPSAWATSLDFAKKPNSKFFGVQIGVTTYSYRSMPHDIKQLLQFILDDGINAIELKGAPMEAYAGKPVAKEKVAEWRANVSMDKFKEIRKMYNKAGVTIYAFKPDNALGVDNTDAEIEYALRAARALGANCVTVELPKESAQTERLGLLAAKHKMYIGYHAHTQASDTAWDVALSQSPYNSMNLDCGHYIAAGGNNTKESLLALIQAKHDRITSLHLKDRKLKVNGGANLPWGEGDTPIKEILNLMKEKKYKFPATIELEYKIPAGSDAVKETKNCVEYAKHALGA
jgi:sugar phosphate isomerase/epimerase